MLELIAPSRPPCTIGSGLAGFFSGSRNPRQRGGFEFAGAEKQQRSQQNGDPELDQNCDPSWLNL
jgi:hypothetical protein